MKDIIIILAILLIIVVGLIVYYTELVNISEDIFETISKIQRAINADDWNIVENEIDILIDEWEDYSEFLSLVIDHNEIDSIMTNIASLEQYAKYREIPELMSEISVVEKLIGHIPFKESLRFENIF